MANVAMVQCSAAPEIVLHNAKPLPCVANLAITMALSAAVLTSVAPIWAGVEHLQLIAPTQMLHAKRTTVYVK